MALLTGHFQNAYVTRNLEEALASFRGEFGVEHFLTFDSAVEIATRQGQGVAELRIALAWLGSLQIEIIEPVGGPVDLYSEPLARQGTLHFHHVGTRVRDWKVARAEIVASGHEIAMEGERDGVHFLYTDERDRLGHFLEYLYMPEAFWTQFNENIPCNG